MKRVLLLTAAITALVAAPAAAQTEYDGTSGSATVSGDSIVVTGEGFIPGATVDYSVDFVADSDENAAAALEASGVMFAKAPSAPAEVVETGSTTADANGNVEFAVENRGPGTYTISMTDGTNSAVATITIDGTGGGTTGDAAGGDLPTTGSDSSIPMAQLGVVLVMVGAVAIYFARRRKGTLFAD